MTEERAKKKWCPMRYTDIADGRCRASDCMAWRKTKDTYGDDYGNKIPDDEGYCGLGGQY